MNEPLDPTPGVSNAGTRRRRAALAGLATVGILLLVTVAAGGALQGYLAGRVPFGVTAGGLHLARDTTVQARAALAREVAARDLSTIVLQTREGPLTLKLADLGVTVDVAATARRAVSRGRLDVLGLRLWYGAGGTVAPIVRLDCSTKTMSSSSSTSTASSAGPAPLPSQPSLRPWPDARQFYRLQEAAVPLGVRDAAGGLEAPGRVQQPHLSPLARKHALLRAERDGDYARGRGAGGVRPRVWEIPRAEARALRDARRDDRAGGCARPSDLPRADPGRRGGTGLLGVQTGLGRSPGPSRPRRNLGRATGLSEA